MKSVTETQKLYNKRGLRRFELILAACFAGILLISSCEKKKDDPLYEIKPGMGGDVYFEVPAYAMVGSSFKLECGGITDPSADSVSYEWTSDHLFKDTVIGTVCNIVVPDSIGKFYVSVTAKAEGYYDKTYTKYISSVKFGPDGSITDYPLPSTTFTDPRDNQTYAVTEIGNLVWFAENLNWKGAGSPYSKADIMGEIVGRLYTWNDATGGESKSGLGAGPQGVCPDGWSVPTKEDWEDLGKALNGDVAVPFEDSWKGLGAKVMIDAKFNGEKFWPYNPDINHENMFGWAALSGGNSTNNYNNYSGMMNYGFWWSSSQMDSNKAYYRYLYYNRSDFDLNYTDKDGFGASVRCVKLK